MENIEGFLTAVLVRPRVTMILALVGTNLMGESMVGVGSFPLGKGRRSLLGSIDGLKGGGFL